MACDEGTTIFPYTHSTLPSTTSRTLTAGKVLAHNQQPPQHLPTSIAQHALHGIRTRAMALTPIVRIKRLPTRQKRLLVMKVLLYFLILVAHCQVLRLERSQQAEC